MFETECTLLRFNQALAHRLAGELTVDQLMSVPVPGLKPPLWVLGHLAIATDYALGLLGQHRACPEPWHATFGPGSDPASLSEAPSRQELMEALDQGVERILAAAPQADSEALARNHPIPMAFLQENVPTVGGLLAHLMTTHFAFHLGQLSTWRRVSGLAQVF